MLPKGLLKEYSRPLSMLLRILDACTILLAGWLAYFYRFDDYQPPSSYLIVLAFGTIMASPTLSFFDIYSSVRGSGFWRHILSLMQALCLLAMLLACSAFITKTGELFSRAWFMLWMSFSLAILVAFRFFLIDTVAPDAQKRLE